MKFGINTLDDVDVRGKTVLCRVDINEPVDKKAGKLRDTTRIEGCLPTIRELSEKGAKTVLLAHQGSDIEYKNYYTLKLHADVISGMLGKPIGFVEDVCGPAAQEAIHRLNDGDVLLLDNVRFMAEEMTLFETNLNLTPEQQADTQVVRKLAPLADVYVCDAFAAAHRAQPTLVGMERVLPSVMGRLFEKEYAILSELMQSPKRPCVYVLGGAKIDDAFRMLGTVLLSGAANRVLTGGLVGNVLLAAAGVDIGEPSLRFIADRGFEPLIARSCPLLAEYGDMILLPQDLSYVDGLRHTARCGDLPTDTLFTDIGEETAALYAEEILEAATVFVNGPMGVFEKPESEHGTKTVWQALRDTSAMTVLGGGDSIAAVNKYEIRDDLTYICTGGGAMVRFLSGEELPVVKALKNAAKRNYPQDSYSSERGL